MSTGTAAKPVLPQELDHTFVAPINPEWAGIDWYVVVMHGSKEFFGTGRAVKVEATVDGHEVSTSFMPTGDGEHMLPLKAQLRKKIGKVVGEDVTVRLLRRLS
jgi:hypothetical protein